MRKYFLLTLSVVASCLLMAQPNPSVKSETRVIIRDLSGSGGEPPLVIIDGKQGGDLQSLSPDKIVKVDVVKGNSATELYGAAGKNGVVIVTTKSGAIKDSIPADSKKRQRVVTVNKFRMKDGGFDTTIVQVDSMVMDVMKDKVIINGMPLDGFMDRWSGGENEPRILLERMKDGQLFWFDKEMGGNATDRPAPRLGLSVQDTDEGKGVQVITVIPAGAAAKAGVQANDRILSIDEMKVNDVDALKEAISKARDKRSVMIHLQRNGKDMHIELVFPRALKKADL